MLIALLATVFFEPVQAPSPSSQCLSEIAATASERLYPDNPVSVELMTRKYVKIWTGLTETVAALDGVLTQGRRLLDGVIADEAAGRAAAGSADRMRAQILRDVEGPHADLGQIDRLAPNCIWPAIPASPAERLS